MTIVINLSDPSVTPEMIVDKLMAQAKAIVKPKYYRYWINGKSMHDIDYASLQEAKDAAQGRYEQMMDDDTPEGIRNGDELTESVIIQELTYDENEDEVFGNQYYAEVSWEYYHGDKAEHGGY